MEQDTVHELTAAYALDALTDEEASEYEEHLRHCALCREDLGVGNRLSTPRSLRAKLVRDDGRGGTPSFMSPSC